ncbi:hypothetical protein KC355_g3698 [Hortaea werneckii]|nr:hypothetical protein KC355_g3698 [Hortaea werneckii]
MDSSKKASSSGGTPNKSKGKGSQQQTPSKQSSTSRPKSDKTTSKEDTKSPKQGSPSNPPKQEQPHSPSPPSKPRATTRTQSPTPRSIFTPANNVSPFTSTVTSAVSAPESQKAYLSSDDDDSPVRRPVDPEAFEEISASEAEGMPGSRKTSAELVREYSRVYQAAVQGPGDEAEFDGDEED